MNNRRIIVRVSIALALVFILGGGLLYSSSRADHASPVPTPVFHLEMGLEEKFSPEDPSTSPVDVMATDVVTFYAEADTQLLQGHPTANYGRDAIMRAGYAGCDCKVLLWADSALLQVPGVRLPGTVDTGAGQGCVAPGDCSSASADGEPPPDRVQQ